MLTLSEPGLYFFLGRSDKPKALPFQKWLAGDVLPSLRKSGRYELPSARLDVGRSLKPALRERLLGDALQMARLCGVGDPEGIDALFERCCAIVAGPAPAQVSAEDRLIGEFIARSLQAAPGSYLAASAVYQRFRDWWRLHGEFETPSQKRLGFLMRRRFRARKKAGYFVYCDCAFA